MHTAFLASSQIIGTVLLLVDVGLWISEQPSTSGCTLVAQKVHETCIRAIPTSDSLPIPSRMVFDTTFSLVAQIQNFSDCGLKEAVLTVTFAECGGFTPHVLEWEICEWLGLVPGSRLLLRTYFH